MPLEHNFGSACWLVASLACRPAAIGPACQLALACRSKLDHRAAWSRLPRSRCPTAPRSPRYPAACQQASSQASEAASKRANQAASKQAGEVATSKRALEAIRRGSQRPTTCSSPPTPPSEALSLPCGPKRLGRTRQRSPPKRGKLSEHAERFKLVTPTSQILPSYAKQVAAPARRRASRASKPHEASEATRKSRRACARKTLSS